MKIFSCGRNATRTVSSIMHEWHPTTGSTFMTSGEKADRVAAFLVSILGAVAIAIAFAVSHAQIAHAASSAEVALTALMQKLSEVRAAGG